MSPPLRAPDLPRIKIALRSSRGRVAKRRVENGARSRNRSRTECQTALYGKDV